MAKFDPATIRVFVCPNDMFPGVPVYAAKRWATEGGQEHRLKSTGTPDKPGVPVCIECGVEAITYGAE